MRDQHHNYKITQCSIEEAIAACSAERQGILNGPLSRDIHGGDVTDIFGVQWDSKRAISRIDIGGPNIFNVKRYVQKMKIDLTLGENIIIDATKLEPSDMFNLIDEISRQLTQTDITRIIIKTGKL